MKVPKIRSPSTGKQESHGPSESDGKASFARALADYVESLLARKVFSRSSQAGETEEGRYQGRGEALAAELLIEVFHHSPDALFIVDGQNGSICFCNQTGATWLDEGWEALIGRDFASLFGHDEGQVATRLWREADSGEGAVLSRAQSDPSREHRLIEFRGVPIKQGEESWVILTGRDLGSGDQSRERELRAERDRLNTIIRSLRDGLVVLSKQGEILYSNPAIDQMLETSDLPEICRGWLKDFAEHDRSGILGFSSPYEGQTLERSLQDGRIFLVTRSFLFEPAGTASVLMIVKDITELRLLEQKGHQLEMELLRESKLAEFGAMAAGIAHNLNGPLTSILGFCDLIAMTQERMPDIERIRTQAMAMKDIIQNLMRKSRQEQNPDPQEISINDLIKTECNFLCANLVFKHDIEKRLELDETLPKIRVVYSDLSQVIGNLLRNAIDALHGRDERHLVVRTRHNERFLFVDVIDTGIGIKSEDLPKLFTRFFTTKAMVGKGAAGEPTGTGFGLSTSRTILARYGAEIFVESTWQKGSTFTIRFPLSTGKASGH